MSAPLNARLRDFAVALLERRGAAVEWHSESDDGYAVLPNELTRRLGGWELLRLSFRADAEGLPVNLAADFLDRVQPLLELEPRAGAYQVPEAYLKQGRIEELVERTFTWQNARVKVQAASPARCEYHVWHFFASLQSEDRFEDCFAVALNAVTGAQIELPEPVKWEARAWRDPPQRRIPKGRLCGAPWRAWRLPGAFVSRMESRLARDRKRLRDYYGALAKEERTKAPGSPEPGPADPAGAVALELRRKLQELDERYMLRIDLNPLVHMRLELPALAIPFEVFRRQSRRALTLYWNPLLGDIEPLACSRCGASMFSLAFTDEEVEPRCLDCLEKHPKRPAKPT